MDSGFSSRCNVPATHSVLGRCIMGTGLSSCPAAVSDISGVEPSFYINLDDDKLFNWTIYFMYFCLDCF
jgi:hypothetical protein